MLDTDVIQIQTAKKVKVSIWTQANRELVSSNIYFFDITFYMCLYGIPFLAVVYHHLLYHQIQS